MKYIDPHHVDSPKNSVSSLFPVYDGGEWNISVTLIKWDGEDRVAMRWNGGTEKGSTKPTPGNPQSRGLPTWFVIDPVFDLAILKTLIELKLIGGGTIDKQKAEKAVHDAIAICQTKNSLNTSEEDLEKKILEIINKLKFKGRI